MLLRPEHKDGIRSQRWDIILECAMGMMVAIVVASVFWPLRLNGFVDHWDDGVNFLRNRDFRGLGWEQLRWAWTTRLQGTYQPIAWMILELQFCLFGLSPAGYHLSSVILHATTAVLFYALILAVTRRIVRDDGVRVRVVSAMIGGVVAMLFAVHPLRVEVVAWASCQPYLPCASFSILTMLAYLRSQEPGLRGTRWLIASLFLFGAAVGCKAPAVGLPVVLLLVDVAVLRRGCGWRLPWKAWVEKGAFFAIALVATGLAIQSKSDEPRLLDPRAPGVARVVERMAIAAYGLDYYVEKTVWPSDLSAYHYLPERVVLSDSAFGKAVFAVLVAGAVAVLAGRRDPAILAAFMSYAILVLPNLGLIRYDVMMAADRYAYLATMPLFVLMAGVLVRGTANSRRPAMTCGAIVMLGLVAIGFLSMASGPLCRVWKDSDSLVSHALRAGTMRPGLLSSHYGLDLIDVGRVADGMMNLRRAVAMAPNDPDARVNLGMMLARQNDLEGTIEQFREAVKAVPDRSDLRRNLGVALMEAGRLDEAVAQLNEAVRLRPDRAIVHVARGDALAALGRESEAIAEYESALCIEPENREARIGLSRLGQLDRLETGRKKNRPAGTLP